MLASFVAQRDWAHHSEAKPGNNLRALHAPIFFFTAVLGDAKLALCRCCNVLAFALYTHDVFIVHVLRTLRSHCPRAGG
jgi:hypothetical protein